MTLNQRIGLFFTGFFLIFTIFYLANQTFLSEYQQHKAADLVTSYQNKRWENLLKNFYDTYQKDLRLVLKNQKSMHATSFSKPEQIYLISEFTNQNQLNPLFKSSLAQSEDETFIQLELGLNQPIQILQDFKQNYFIAFIYDFSDIHKKYLVMLDMRQIQLFYFAEHQDRNYVFNQHGDPILGQDPGFIKEFKDLSWDPLISNFYENTKTGQDYIFIVTPFKDINNDIIGYWVTIENKTTQLAEKYVYLTLSTFLIFAFFIWAIFMTNAYLKNMLTPLQKSLEALEAMIAKKSDSFVPFNDNIPDYEKLEDSLRILNTRQISYDLIQTQKVQFQKSMFKYLSIKKELDVAAKLQLSILPEGNPGTIIRDCKLKALMIPAKEVGGDFYDYFKIDDNRLAIVVADVSGKGIPAALFMILTRTLLKAQAALSDSIPDLLKRVNQILTSQNHEMMFVTVFFGIYDARTKSFTYCNAGHPPAYLYDSARQSFTALELTQNMALGIDDSVSFTTHKITLKKGQSIFAYSDGVTDAINDQNEDYGMRFTDLKMPKDLSLEKVPDVILSDIKGFVKEVDQFDDITMLILGT
ncbi:MAG: serine/threonine-protein phosphatase [Alphaproteobacteria bacterium]|jgi:hypothetical protein|nr:serine/threonine-protein phosphatase [Alphaproteobacteria bacterium]